MKGFKIHLICHGAAEGSAEGRYIGRMDVNLSEEGKKQILDIIKDENCSYPEIDAVISSPLKRCIETSKLIYPDHQPLIIDELAEYDFGEFEGKTADELMESEEFKTWIAGGYDVAAPYGESNSEFGKRVCLGFKKIVEGVEKSGYRSVAVVTHGGVIMTLMEKFALPENPMNEWILPGGHGYTLNFNARIWDLYSKIEAFDLIPHINYDPAKVYADIGFPDIYF